MLGALTKGTVPVIQTMVADVANRNSEFEPIYALYSLIVSIATAIAPVLFGIIADKIGIIQVFVVSAGFAILAIIAAIGLRLSYRAQYLK